MKRSFLFLLCLVLAAAAYAQSPVWVKGIGAPQLQLADRSTVDASGNLYVTGRFSGTNVDFDPSPAGTFLMSANGSLDGYVAKYDAAGNFIWAFRIGGSDADEVNDIALDHSGNFVISGYIRGTADMDPSAGTAFLTSNGDSGSDPGYGGDLFVAKYTVNGAYVWAFHAGGTTLYDNAVGIATDNADNVIVGGYFRETPDFDPGAGTAILDGSNGTAFVAKYNSAGQYVWAFNFGQGFTDNTVFDVQTDASNNVYYSGFFQGSNIDMDPGVGVQLLSSAGQADIVVGKLTSSGQYVWARSAGGSGWDVSYHVAVDAAGNVYHTGAYASLSADFDPGAGSSLLTSNGTNDTYLAKWSSTGSFLWAVPIGGPASGFEYGNTISFDAQGNPIVAGSFEGTIDLDPSAAVANIVSAGGSDGFFAKYSPTGSYLCGGRVGGSSTEIIYDLISFGTDFYLSGFFSSPNTDMDPGAGTLNLATAGSEDIMIGRYNWNTQTAAGTLAGSSVCTGQTGQLTFNATAGTGPFTLTISNGASTVTYNNIVSGTPFTSNPAPTGTTTYTLTSIKDANTCSTVVPVSSTATVSVTAMAATATVSGAICRGDSAQLTATGGSTYSWSPATGLSAASIANPKASPASTTTYTVTVTSGACSTTRTVTVTVNAAPTVTLAPASASFCPGDSVQLAATGGGTYAWFPATGLSAVNIANPKAAPAATTTYKVIVTNAQGCRDSATTVITRNPGAVASATAANNTICMGDNTQLSATGGGGYQWSPAASLSSAAIANPVATPVTTTTYKVLVTNAQGCKDSSTTMVTVNPKPVVSLGPDLVLCGGSSITLDATTPGATQYTWSNGGTTATISVNSAGTYSVAVQAGGCLNPARDTVVVSALSLPTVSLGPDKTICTDANLQLTFQGTGYTSSVWSTGSTASTVTVNTAGQYWIRVQNSCGAASDTLNLATEICNDDIYFPTGFTPDGNGRNDQFKALHAPGVTVAYYRLYIYNRWGNLVFSTTNLDGGWDGTIKGKAQGINTFVYFAQYRRHPGDREVRRKGTFVLIR